ncbi:MAG TPA: hypothetical protein VFO97_04700 [Desertimonas sp.]|nr:hypothetical protein [Desertimonas sp.]
MPGHQIGTHIGRRSFLAGLGALAATTTVPGRAAGSGTNTALAVRGVNYDTDREPALWKPEFVAGEMAAIADDLRCDSVILLGHDFDRLLLSAERARQAGLGVWFEPRQFDANAADTLEFVATVAEAAEALRADQPDVTLSLGVELTIFMAGLVPGDSWDERGTALETVDYGEVMGRLNGFLAEALGRVRPLFGGQITYSSGPWEDVDWTGFDVVGVDMYRDATNAATFADDVRALHSHGKPVVITEFGCCTFRGAEDLGGTGFLVVDWSVSPPELREGTVRDEQVQADYLDELLTIFESEGVHGAFVYDFIQPGSPHIPEAPQYDYDTASFSVVKCFADDHPQAYATTGYFEPKLAFDTVARRYA